MIEIQQPEIEALIQNRLVRGDFASVNEVLLQALTDAPMPKKQQQASPRGTGLDLIAALRNSPLRDIDLDFESHRRPITVREFEF